MNAINWLKPWVRLFGGLAPGTMARLMVNLSLRPGRQVRQRPLADGVQPGEWVTFRFGQQALRWGYQGPVVLAMHGWQGRPEQFRYLASKLAEQGYQVFALNGPGHGSDLSKEAHLGLFAGYLHEVAAELSDVHAVVGHSFGAAGALVALASGLAVERAVVIAAPNGVSGILDHLTQRFGLPAPVQARFERLVEQRVGLAVEALQAAQLLRSVHRPLLVIHDQEDRAVPVADAEAIHRGARRARLHITTGLGHSGGLYHEAVAAQVLEFLADADAEASERRSSTNTVEFGAQLV